MGMIANRLRKNLRHLRKWARREGIACYRVYDRDIPEHPVTVDWYDGRAVAWAALRTRDGTHADRQAWLAEVQAEVAEGLEIPPDLVFLKERRPGGQYRREGATRAEFVVPERDLRFLVNLSDYHDTGLFLDHRDTRALVRSEAAGRRFLNLFCYTGTFTAYAARGGAAATDSVDLSATYLDWTWRNLELNDLDGPRHTLLREDVLPWLPRAARQGRSYGLIVCDPPTFSNSKRMRGALDVQRDHPELIHGCLALLEPGGALYFSTNERGFELRLEGLPGVEEITARTVPGDYAGHCPHRCWRIVRAPH